VRPEGLCQTKIPVTPSGIEPATLRLIAQCHPVAHFPPTVIKNYAIYIYHYFVKICQVRILYHFRQLITLSSQSSITCSAVSEQSERQYRYRTSRPVFRYFTPLGSRKFCAPLPNYLFVFSVMCKQKQHKNGQKTKHYGVSLGYKIKAKITKTTRSRCRTNIVFSIDLP
jgi:hypothetical protein